MKLNDMIIVLLISHGVAFVLGVHVACKRISIPHDEKPALSRVESPSTGSIDEWWAELTKLANENNVSWALAEMEDHRDSFNDGLSPAEELEAQLSCVVPE